jgi:hypothetical protein
MLTKTLADTRLVKKLGMLVQSIVNFSRMTLNLMELSTTLVFLSPFLAKIGKVRLG